MVKETKKFCADCSCVACMIESKQFKTLNKKELDKLVERIFEDQFLKLKDIEAELRGLQECANVGMFELITANRNIGNKANLITVLSNEAEKVLGEMVEREAQKKYSKRGASK